MGLEKTPVFRALWAAAVVAVTLGPVVAAQEETITFDWYHAGGGVHRATDHVPFHALLENPTGEDRVVRLEGRWEGLYGKVHRRIELAAGARKEVDFYLGPAGPVSAFEVVLRSLPSGGTQAGEVIEEVQLSSVPLVPGRLVVGILSPHPMGWASLRRGGAFRGGAFDGKTIHLEPHRLPGSAFGLGAFDVLIWPRPRPWQLRREQLRGLVHWLEDGGHLVLAGVEAGRHALEPWTRTVALEPLAVRRLDALEAVAGVPLGRFAEPLAVTPLQAPTGRVWLHEPWGALAVDESRGLGSLTVLGFDPTAAAVAGWPGLGSFWLRLLERRGLAARREPGSGRTTWDPGMSLDPRSVARALLTVDRGGPVLPAFALGLVLLLYLAAIGPGEYYLLRRLGKLKWTWFTFPVWVGLASVGAYAVAAGTRGEADVVRHILQRDLAPGAGSFRDQLHASLFATRAGAYRLAPRRPGALPLAPQDPTSVRRITRVMRHGLGYGSTLGFGSRQRTWMVEESQVFWPTYQQGAGAISSRLAKWSFLAGSFEGRAPADGAGVAAELEWVRRAGVRGRVVPRLGVDLEGAWLLASAGGQPLRARLHPRRDGEPISVQEPWDAEVFARLVDLLRGGGRPDRFVDALSLATVRGLLLKQLSAESEGVHGLHPFRGNWEWELLASDADPRHDWSALLEAGGAVFLGWASEPAGRLDVDASGSGLVVYRVGIAPQALRPPAGRAAGAQARRGTEL